MRRTAFLMLGALTLLRARAVRAQSDADPASSSNRPALRVLLGTGQAVPSSPDLFDFDGRSYRGSFQRLDNGQIVNVVDLEEYLCSVVAREMPSRWALAALEAQSICARTYVLARSDPRREYDLVPSELDQVYEGIAGETPQATAAVNATSGQVLKFGANFAHVAYSSCCGGHTAASSDAWSGAPIPYLGGVVCTFCSSSPNYRWSTALSLETVASRFSTALAPLGDLEDVRVAQRDSSGRARALELVAQRGNTTVAGTIFRRGVGGRALPSLLITKIGRDPGGAELLVEGGGLGHGVGLCQWGAQGMALTGHSSREILSYYFPGTATDGANR